MKIKDVLLIILAIVASMIIRVTPVFIGLYLSNHGGFARYDADLVSIYEAEKALKDGRAEEALAKLERLEVLNSNRGCWIVLMRAAAYCTLHGHCKQVQDETEFGRFTCRIFNTPDLYDKLQRYCEVVAVNKDPQAAADLIDGAMYLDSWLSPRCDLQLLQAQYYLQGGDTQKAAALCQRIWDDGKENSWDWNDVENDLEFKSKILELKKKAGESAEKWLMASELKDFPENCCIYIQPVGNVNMELIEEVRSNVALFFGAPVDVLEPLPLTKGERSYMNKGQKFNADLLRPDLLQRLQIPTNAFSVVMLTGEKIGTPYLNWIYAQSTGNGHLVSYYIWRDWSHYWQVHTLSRVVVSMISGQLDMNGEFPCVTASCGNMDTMRRVKFAYAPAMQEKYKAIDLEAVQKKSIEDYKVWGATIGR